MINADPGFMFDKEIVAMNEFSNVNDLKLLCKSKPSI